MNDPDSSEQKNKKSVTCIIGDSMLKNVQGWKMNKKLPNDFTVVKSFSGATTECMHDYVKPSIKQKPDRFIIHVGTNDLKSANTASNISKKIIGLAKSCAEVQVVISSVIKRGDELKGKAIYAS